MSRDGAPGCSDPSSSVSPSSSPSSLSLGGEGSVIDLLLNFTAGDGTGESLRSRKFSTAAVPVATENSETGVALPEGDGKQAAGSTESSFEFEVPCVRAWVSRGE